MSTDVKITAARLHRVRMPLVHEFRTSSHRKTFLEHILVELEDASGAVGWGEIASPSDPYYAPETVETCWHVAEHYLLPAVHRPGLGSARAGVASCGPRSAATSSPRPAWTSPPGCCGPPCTACRWPRRSVGPATEVVAGVSLGIEPTIDDLLAEVERQTAAGYPRVKLKIAPGWDVEPVRAVRAAYPELDLHVDANGIYTEDAPAALRALDEFGLTMIEQPFAPRDLLAHARLQRTIATPVCLDESIETLDDLETALSVGRATGTEHQGVADGRPDRRPRGARSGAAGRESPVWCGGMHEFGIGRAANVAVSSLPGFTLPSDVSASEKYYARDIVEPAVVAVEGVVQVPEATGLGHKVDTDLIAANTVATLSL